jgi:hypothetical protein
MFNWKKSSQDQKDKKKKTWILRGWQKDIQEGLAQKRLTHAAQLLGSRSGSSCWNMQNTPKTCHQGQNLSCAEPLHPISPPTDF